MEKHRFLLHRIVLLSGAKKRRWNVMWVKPKYEVINAGAEVTMYAYVGK